MDDPFDIHPIVSATLDDLDMDLFRRVYLPTAVSADQLEQNQRSPEQQLASLRFTTPETPPHPTVLGILVAGKDPGLFLPGAYVQFLRIDGIELTDPIKDQKEIRGPLSDLLRMLSELLTIHIAVASDITSGPVEIRKPDYSVAALRQLAYNAILHRTYEGTNAPVRVTWFSDRVEILNPGGPFGQVTRQNWGQPGVTDYRNPHVAEAMKNLGYVQRFGVGIEIARRELAGNGNPPPDFDVQDTYVWVTVRKAGS
jgi:ATP-dependent DNA helicase RecG